jgi:hypothetical protein
MSTVALLVITDRPEYLERTLFSAARYLPAFDQYVEIIDDEHRLGFAGAIAAGWCEIDCEYVFHLEDDFVFDAPVPVEDMIRLLKRHPELTQVSLKRQAWSPEERAAGGIVECHPEDFDEVSDEQATWTEHRSYFTTTPSVYPAQLCELGWPQCPHSEGIFTHQLLEDPALRFAIWGGKFDAPRCEHIGEVRAGCGY